MMEIALATNPTATIGFAQVSKNIEISQRNLSHEILRPSNIEFLFEGCSSRSITEVTIVNCAASSEYSDKYSCEKAYDGRESEPAWSTNAYGTDSWIEISFDRAYILSSIHTMQRPCRGAAHFKDVTLQIAGGKSADYTLSGKRDKNPNLPVVWDKIETDFAYNDATNYVKISAISFYTIYTTCGGFSELKVYGCTPGRVTQCQVSSNLTFLLF